MTRQHPHITDAEEAFLLAAREWSEAKLAEAEAGAALDRAQRQRSDAQIRRLNAEGALAEAQHGLLTDMEADAANEAGAAGQESPDGQAAAREALCSWYMRNNCRGE